MFMLRICLPPNCPTPAQMEQQMTVFLTLWWPMTVVGIFLCVSMDSRGARIQDDFLLAGRHYHSALDTGRNIDFVERLHGVVAKP